MCVVALLLDLLLRCARLASGLLSGKLHGSHEYMHNQAQEQSVRAPSAAITISRANWLAAEMSPESRRY